MVRQAFDTLRHSSWKAHWKIGAVDNALKGAKELMTKLCLYDHDLTPQQALAEAITTFNHKELVRGYSPAQHVLGQAPDETGRLIPSGNQLHPDLVVENPIEEFERGVRLRAEAEKALSDWSAHQRLMRAKHSRHRTCYDYTRENWCATGGPRTPTRSDDSLAASMVVSRDRPESWRQRLAVLRERSGW